MIAYVLTGWFCATLIGCDHTPFVFGPEVYKDKADCERRIEGFRNGKYILSYEFTCEPHEVDPPCRFISEDQFKQQKARH